MSDTYQGPYSAFYMMTNSKPSFCANCKHPCHCEGSGKCMAGELEVHQKTWETKTKECKCTECQCKKMYTDPKWGETTTEME